MTIRNAHIDDCDIIVQFQIELAKSENLPLPNKETLYKGVLRSIELNLYKVFIKNNIVVGCSRVQKQWSDWANGYKSIIDSVYVIPGQRGYGIGKQLILACIDKNDISAELHVNKNNKIAINCYKSLSFEHDVDYLIMNKTIS